MTICRSCSGEAVKVLDGRVVQRGCGECVAQSLIKNENNPLGVMSFESASKLCSCLANMHQGEIDLPKSEAIDKMNEIYHKDVEEKSERPENIYDKKSKAEKEYYQTRLEEVKKKDAENGSPNWVE